LVCSPTGRNLGRPWATFLSDAFSRRLLAVCLTFDPQTNCNHTSGGIRGTREGSIPSPTAEHQSGAPLLNNDRMRLARCTRAAWWVTPFRCRQRRVNATRTWT
jgi:hypothetical protein